MAARRSAGLALACLLLLTLPPLSGGCAGENSEPDPWLEAQAIERMLLADDPTIQLSDPRYLRVARSLNRVERTHAHHEDAQRWLRTISDARRVALADADARFSRLPPRLQGSTPDEGPGVLSADAPDDLQAPVEVTLYGASWCGACKRTRAWLDQRAIPFRDVDVDESTANRRELAELAGPGSPIPVVVVAGAPPIVGFRPQAISEALTRAREASSRRTN